MIFMKKYIVRPRLTPGRRFLIGNQDEGREHVFLGRLSEAGQLVRLDYDLVLPHVVAIFGKRGSGKSYTLGSFVEGLCTEDSESTISAISKRHAALLFDTLGIFQWLDIPLSLDSPQNVVKEQARVQVGWDIKSEPLKVRIWKPRGSMLSAIGRNFKDFTMDCSDFTASDWGYLFGVDIVQDRMGQLLNDVYEKVVNDGWSDGTYTYPPKVKYAIEDLMDCVQKDAELAASYHSETRRAVLQQLSVYWHNPLFQPKRKIPSALKSLVESGKEVGDILKVYESLEGTPLSELLRPGQLSVLVLNKISDELRFILIVGLIRKIMRARIETSEMEKNLKILPNLTEEDKQGILDFINRGVPPTWVIADEAQNFLPSERKTTATEVLVRLVREGRNYGLSFMLTTQQPQAIDQRILAQVDTMIIHKLAVQGDIDYVRRNLKSGLPEEIKYGNTILSFDELLRGLDVGQAIVSDTETDRILTMSIRPRVTVHGGFGV